MIQSSMKIKENKVLLAMLFYTAKLSVQYHIGKMDIKIIFKILKKRKQTEFT